MHISIVDVTKYAVTSPIDTLLHCRSNLEKFRKIGISLNGDLQYQHVVFARDGRKRFCECCIANLEPHVEP
jgi:hypothetical protein